MSLSGKNPVFGATLMVAGCCIGAGMLALPLATLPSGFFLSILPLLIGWSYSYLSGLMVLEVCLNTKQQFHLMGLLDQALGKSGKITGSGLFFFLFYSLLAVYLNASSALIQEALNGIFQINVPKNYYLLFNSVILFLIVVLGAKTVDLINRYLVFSMIFFYLCLIYVGISQFGLTHLNVFSHVATVLWAIPIFILSFGFQNLVPTLFHYLKRNVKKTKAALFRGTFAALMIYLIWNLVVLGASPTLHQDLGRGTTGDLIKLFNISGPRFAFFIKNFSFFAILTSILTVALSFVNFIADSSQSRKNRVLYAACALLPPTIFSSVDPDTFLKILKIAGGVGSVLLFGVFPPLMIWGKRRMMKEKYREIFPFGNKGIAAYLFVSLSIITLEVLDLIGMH